MLGNTFNKTMITETIAKDLITPVGLVKGAEGLIKKDYLDRVMNTNEYYADGNLKAVTDAYGNQTQYKYNYDGKITEIKDALGNTTTYVYGGGAIGSTIAMTDQGQNVVNKYAYSAFGAVLNQVEAVPQPFKYVGQYGVMAES